MGKWLFIATRLVGALTPFVCILWLRSLGLDGQAAILIAAVSTGTALLASASFGQHTTAIFDGNCTYLARSSHAVALTLIPAAIASWHLNSEVADIWLGGAALYHTFVAEIYCRATKRDALANIFFLKFPIIAAGFIAYASDYFMIVAAIIGASTYAIAYRSCKTGLEFDRPAKLNRSIWLNSIVNYGLTNADVVISLFFFSTEDIVTYFLMKRCFMAIEPLYPAMTASLSRDLRDSRNVEKTYELIIHHMTLISSIALGWVSLNITIVIYYPHLITSTFSIPENLLSFSWGFFIAIIATAASAGLGYVFVYFNKHRENLMINSSCLLLMLTSSSAFLFLFNERTIMALLAPLVFGLAAKAIMSWSLVNKIKKQIAQ